MVATYEETTAPPLGEPETAERDIDWALKSLASRREQYAKFRRYYEGNQQISYTTEKMRKAFGHRFRSDSIVDNFASSVVDAMADRLQVTGFTAEGADPDKDPTRTASEAIWRRNRMDRRSGEVHSESLTAGDAYVIVWPGPDGKAVLWPQEAHEVTVKYDPESPDRIVLAAKVWYDEDEKCWRLTLYYADRLEKYATAKSDTKSLPTGATGFRQYESVVRGADGIERTEPWPVPNPYGVVPVFHFGNNARTNAFGRSELVDVIPLQDTLNKSRADMTVASEFFAAPQRWAIGIEPQTDETTGAPKPVTMEPLGLFMAAGGDGENRPAFGEFAASGPTNFLDVQREDKADIARVSKTPLHILMLSSDAAPSGEALKTAETPFVKKIRDRQRDFGSDWADAMRLALAIEGSADVSLETTWEDPAPRSEVDTWSVALLKKQAGVSRKQILRENGYTEKEIDDMAAENAEAAEAAQSAFAAGAGVPMGRRVADDDGGEAE